MKNFLLLISMMFMSILVRAQEASVQVIHNSPIPGTNAGPVIDIYVNGVLLPQLTGMEFREATSYLTLPSEVEISLDVRLNPSTIDDDPMATFALGMLTDGETYTIVAGGVAMDVPGLPDFDLFVNTGARKTAVDPEMVDFNGFHGGILVPPVTVSIKEGPELFTAAYGQYSAYFEVEPGEYYLDVDVEGLGFNLTYLADFSGLSGQSLTVFASGVALGSPELGIFAALANGTVVELPYSPVARVQLIQNAPDTAVDVYINGALAYEEFEFRTATPYMFLPAETSLEIAITPAGSGSTDDAIEVFDVILATDETYQIIVNGIDGDVDYPFTLAINEEARESAMDTTKAEMNVFHGSPGTPNIDIAIKYVGNIIEDMEYNNFTDYLPLEAGTYYLDIKATGDDNIVASFIAEIPNEFIGEAFTVMVSGILDGSPGFGLFAIFENGTVVELPVLEYVRVQIIHNSPGALVDVYVNTELLISDFTYRTASPFVDIPAGIDVEIAIAEAGSTDVNDAIANFDYVLEVGNDYVIIANGILGDDDFPFNLAVNTMAREFALEESEVDFSVFHGAQEAPDLSIDMLGVGTIIPALTYNQYSDYISMISDIYYLNVVTLDTNDLTFTYELDLVGFEGQGVTIIASGIYGGDPGFELLAVWNNGTVTTLRQTSVSRVQIIHNSPEPAVDIYLDGALLLEDFNFRDATSFINLESGLNYSIAVALAGSESVDDAFATFDFEPEDGLDYVIVAGGIIDDVDFPFGLFINPNGRSSGSDPDATDIAVFHGSPGAPPVDIEIVSVGGAVEGLTYGEFTDYSSFVPAYYLLNLSETGSDDVIATFEADLRGLAGQAATIIASGILDGDPTIGLFAVFANGTVMELPQRQFARAQIIHNSPEPLVDVYINDVLLLAGFEFRGATPFIDIVAGVDLEIAVAAAGSSSSADALAIFNATFEADKTYIIIANGILEDEDFPFYLAITDSAKEEGENEAVVDMAIFHGAPGAPTLDISARGIATLVSDLTYGAFTPYGSLTAQSYLLDVNETGVLDILATFYGDLRDFGGEAAMLFVSGTMDSLPGFGLFAAFPNGDVVELPRVSFTHVQLLHNSPEPAVDIYLDDMLVFEGFEFRQGTPFIEFPTGIEIDIAVAAAGNTEYLYETSITLDTAVNYIIIANGVVGSDVTPFEFVVYEDARMGANQENTTDVALFHGSPNTPAVGVTARYVGVIVESIAFGEATYYFELPSQRYLLDITLPGMSDIGATFVADFSDLQGRSGLVFASGFLGTEEPILGLFLLLDNGDVIELPATALARVQVIHNAVAPTVDVYIGDELAIDDFAYRTATGFIELPADVNLALGVAPETSTSVDDVLATFDIEFENGKDYIMLASGIMGDMDFPLDLIIYDEARTEAASSEVDVLIHHGAPGVVDVDVAAREAGVLATNLSYGDFSDYVTVPASDYIVELLLAGTETILEIYEAPLTDLSGQSITVFASGLREGAPEFGVWVTLANGVTFPLTAVTAVKEKAGFKKVELFPNPATHRTLLSLEVNESLRNIFIDILDIQGRPVQAIHLDQLPAGRFTQEINLNNMASGAYFVRITTQNGRVVLPLIVTGR